MRVYLYLCVGVLAFILCIYICVCPRLAEECASDPLLKENAFTAPSKHGDAQDSLESLCQCLLRCCDSVWIPTVIVRAHSTDARVRFIIELIVKKTSTFLSHAHACNRALEKMILQFATSLFRETCYNDYCALVRHFL